MSQYSYSRTLSMDFETALEKTENALKENGFGIITRIDAKETLKNKLGVDFVPYVILGACNPKFAYQALTIEREVGLLLPCNVIVYEENNTVNVATLRASVAMSVSEKNELHDLAMEVENLLIAAINTIK